MRTPQTAARNHLETYLVGPAASDGAEGVATVDRHGKPYVVSFLGFAADGSPRHWRRTVPPDPTTPDADAASLAARALAAGRPVDWPFSSALEWFGLKGDRYCAFAAEVDAAYAMRNPDLPLPEGRMEAAAAAILARSGLAAVSARVSVPALQSLKCIGEYEAAPYVYYARDDEVGLARRQAAASYPLLAKEIATRPVLKYAVDRRQPLGPKLESAFGAGPDNQPFMTKALLRRFANLSQPDHGLEASAIVEFLGRVPADWFPRTDADWDAFCDLVHGFRNFADQLEMRPDELLPNTGGKWADARGKVAKASASTQPPLDLDPEAQRAWRPVPDESPEGLRGAFEGALTMVRMFAHHVVLPAAAATCGEEEVPLGPEGERLAFEAAAQILFKRQGAVATMKLQRHWHTQLPAIIEACADPDAPPQPAQHMVQVAEDGWAPLTDVQLAPNGVYAVPLTDPRQLKAEGSSGVDENGARGLNHCVGTYVEQCRRAQSHIVSFREIHPDGTYRRLSTAEFSAPGPDSDKLTLRQNYTWGNTTPPPEAAEACKWFMAEVEARRIPINRDGIMAYLGGRPKVTDPIQKLAGYDRRNLGIVERVMKAWEPYLPKESRGLGIDGFRELPEMAKVCDYVAPRYRAFAP